jgi:HTH-type transcriptional regulator/antitoxin HipB
MSPLSETVKAHRRLAGLSRLELANLADVGKTAIFDIEHNKQTVRLDTVLKVLSALNVSLHYTSPVMQRLFPEGEISGVQPPCESSEDAPSASTKS